MRVYKFGGASIKDAEAVRNMAELLKGHSDDTLFIVVSAIDKTTNCMERLTASWYGKRGKQKEALYNSIKEFHYELHNDLLSGNSTSALGLAELFEKLRSTIDGDAPDSYDLAYEMIVPFGELFSSHIIWHYLTSSGLSIDWLDARRHIITDDTYREACIDWVTTTERLRESLQTMQSSGGRLSLTQGFIGSTREGQTVTLGREGSDYTAAIIAYTLDAKEVVIWKDVPGLMNADPAIFPDAVVLEEISFHEAIELAYFGAKVIHPKTIKPLQNKNIPLRVKSFLQPSLPGSLIHALDKYDQDIPSYIIKEHQTLISFSPKDFSFIAERNISDIFSTLSKLNIRANVIQNSAISFSVCIDNERNKVKTLMDLLQDNFTVRYNRGLTLITIRHFTEEIIMHLTSHAEVLLEQRSRNTAQLVIKSG